MRHKKRGKTYLISKVKAGMTDPLVDTTPCAAMGVALHSLSALTLLTNTLSNTSDSLSVGVLQVTSLVGRACRNTAIVARARARAAEQHGLTAAPEERGLGLGVVAARLG